MKVDLSGARALVGGSTSGIGETIAVTLADAGADVVVHGRSESKGKRVVERCEERGVSAHFVAADMTDYDAVKRAVDEGARELGGLDVVVPNGGVSGGPAQNFFVDLPPEDIAAFDTFHYVSRLYFVKAALDHLRESDDGRVINITSDAGRMPTPGEVGPGSAAAAVMMATRTLASELSRWEITVNAVALTVIQDTELLDELIEGSAISSIMETAVERQVFEVTSEDVAELVTFLAGADGAKPITGQTISVTGGVSY